MAPPFSSQGRPLTPGQSLEVVRDSHLAGNLIRGCSCQMPKGAALFPVPCSADAIIQQMMDHERGAA